MRDHTKLQTSVPSNILRGCSSLLEPKVIETEKVLNDLICALRDNYNNKPESPTDNLRSSV